MIFHPHRYQSAAIDWMVEQPFAGVFADPGLGKTVITLSALKRLNGQHKTRSVLLVAPLRTLYSVWPNEIAKWDHLRSTPWHNHHADRKADPFAPGLHGVNPELLPSMLTGLQGLARWPFDTLVVDESSKFKSPSGKRFKALAKMLDRFERRYILTGTPAPNSYMDLWSQLAIVDRGELLGKNVTAYRNRYFDQLQCYWGGVDYRLRPGADIEINELIAQRVMRIDAADWLHLPELQRHNVMVALPDDVRAIYDSFEKILFAEIDGADEFATTAAHKYLVCHQVASGGLYQGDERTIKHLHHAKTDACADLVDELQGKPVLVAYRYRHDLERLRVAFGHACPHIGSGETARDVERTVDAWNRKQIPVLLCHPGSMAHGLNMQAGGNDVVWYSLTDSLEEYQQLNARIWRQGVVGECRVHHILAENTVDLAILARLRSKGKTQKSLLDALKEYRSEK